MQNTVNQDKYTSCFVSHYVRNGSQGHRTDKRQLTDFTLGNTVGQENKGQNYNDMH